MTKVLRHPPPVWAEETVLPPDAQPLYRQVYDHIVSRIARGAWRAGDLLPTEQALSKELKVSVGTVRKACDLLAAEKLLARRQGKGTFVAQTTAERSLFRFFRLTDARGQRAVPTSSSESIRKRAPQPRESNALRLQQKDLVFEINRKRLINGKVAALERIVIPVKLFPDFDKRTPLPNSLYTIYQLDYGVHIVRADERIRAVKATAQDASMLRIEPGDAVLSIERLAISMSGEPVELRNKRCSTNEFHYAVSLS